MKVRHRKESAFVQWTEEHQNKRVPIHVCIYIQRIGTRK